MSRTNIVFVMSDDHAAHAISAYGSRVNSTPHLDRIATLAGNEKLPSVGMEAEVIGPYRQREVHNGLRTET